MSDDSFTFHDQLVQVTKHHGRLIIQAGTPRPKPKFVLVVNRGKTPEFK